MKLCLTLIIAASFASVTAADARPPTARRAVGTVESVDIRAQRIVLRADEREDALALSFDRRTAVWRGSEAVTAEALTRGQRVQVSYRLPFFGPDYASRLVLFSPAQPANHKTK